MGQRKVRRGIVFVAVLEVAILCLVVSGIGLWPEREEHADAAAIAQMPTSASSF